MRFSLSKKVLVAATVCCSLGLVASLAPLSQGQESAKKKAAAEAKEPAKPKGRLPAYYKDLVTEEQKSSIYDIQEKYDAQLDALNAQLEKLRNQRDNEIEGLLTAEQKTKLAGLRADTKKKKKSDDTATKKTASSEKKAASGK